MDFEFVQQQLGAPLGSASVIVIDEFGHVDWLVDKTVAHSTILRQVHAVREGTSGLNNIPGVSSPAKRAKDIDCFITEPPRGEYAVRFGEFSTMAFLQGSRSFARILKRWQRLNPAIRFLQAQRRAYPARSSNFGYLQFNLRIGVSCMAVNNGKPDN